MIAGATVGSLVAACLFVGLLVACCTCIAYKNRRYHSPHAPHVPRHTFTPVTTAPPITMAVATDTQTAQQTSNGATPTFYMLDQKKPGESSPPPYSAVIPTAYCARPDQAYSVHSHGYIYSQPTAYPLQGACTQPQQEVCIQGVSPNPSQQETSLVS